MRVASLVQMFAVQVAALVAELPRVGHRTHSQRSRPWCAACVSAPALGCRSRKQASVARVLSTCALGGTIGAAGYAALLVSSPMAG